MFYKPLTARYFLKQLENFSESKYTWILFWLFSFFIFTPFFIYASYIVSTTDSLFNHYPNIIYGYREWHQHSLGLWNPYIFAGMDFTTSFHDHLLNPANWPLLLVPEKYIFSLLTVIEFIEIALIGVLAFKIFNLFAIPRIGILFLALVTQLSGFTWFCTMTFIGVEGFFLTMLILYLFLTLDNRSVLFNFVYLVLGFFFLFGIGHFGFIAAFGTIIAAVFFVKNYPFLLKPWRYPVSVVISAFLFSMAMSAYRWYPILSALLHSGTAQGSLWPQSVDGTHGYLLLTGMIPGIFGTYLGESATFFSMLGSGAVHIQMHNLLYFGMPAVFVILLAGFGGIDYKVRTVGLLAILGCVTFVYLIQPLSDIVGFITAPLVTTEYFRIVTSFVMFASIGYVLYGMTQTNNIRLDLFLKGAILIAGLFLCAAIAYYSRVFGLILSGSHYALPLFIFLKLVLTALFVCTIIAVNKINLDTQNLVHMAQRIIMGVLLVAFLYLFGFVIYLLMHHPVVINFTPLFYTLCSMIWAYATFYLLTHIDTDKQLHKNVLLVLGILFCIVMIFINPKSSDQQNPYLIAYSIFAVLRFIAVFAVTWVLFLFLRDKKISMMLFLSLIFFFAAGDLLFYTKVYEYAGMNPPFVSVNSIYPGDENMYQSIMSRQNKLDLWDYRMNRPHLYTHNPSGAAQSNIFMIYGLRSYGGVDSIVSDKLERFILAMKSHETWFTRAGIVPRSKNQRFLDLMGVKYDFDTQKKLIIRPNALSRFSAFSDSISLPTTQQQLTLVASPKFNVDKIIVTSGIALASDNQRRFIPLQFKSSDTDHIQLHLHFAHPSIILFDDSFSPDWKASWNHRPIPIYLADGYFMAVDVPAGSGVLRFTFYPSVFIQLCKLSVGLAIVLLLLVLFEIIRWKRV
ncbi:MAG: hypothetical protein A3C44_07515 [Gammaproteobacteria bacterium RIFCSPHIGHO2_02_FULL_39_13]|nr:MAG: hypothetical protein A3C44_07515 [Gammaproteobacteria bacterium RIFCSPHIGHO2_02_FULL_39_13]OGT48951.1 MAG: hypothetical protein A3E53_01495 [Gammaproteobacteria bacterium RIFCSPHIGHO2_12_FULL_39_24]